MSFKKINLQDMLVEKRKNPEFDKEYQKIRQEYKLIDRIVDERKKKNLTQKELAAITGISQQSISRIERERHIPQMNTFIKLLEGLDLELTIVTK